MENLTKRQKEIYEYLREILGNRQHSPSIAELSEYFGFRSSRAVRDHLKALERKGFITREANKARSIQVVDYKEIEFKKNDAIPLLGSIPAGHPELHQEDIERYVYVDRQSLGFKPVDKCFALRVAGDSMIGKGIYDGDIVIVDGTDVPKDGSIVAALIDNESTLKTFVDQNGNCYLKPENDKYQELMPLNDLVVQGVVKTVIRNLD